MVEYDFHPNPETPQFIIDVIRDQTKELDAITIELQGADTLRSPNGTNSKTET